MKQNPTFIFIGGSGRSGTTLVQKILLGHPEVSGGPELYFTKPIFDLLNQMQEAHEGNCFHPSISKEDLKDRIVQLYNSILLPHDKGNTKYISEKTPSNVFIASTLLKVYPNAIFIHVFRDGRAVLNSHLDVKKRAKKKGKNLTEISIKRTSINWNNSIRAGLEVKREFPNRVINISYENLIENPQKVLAGLFLKLKLSSYDKMLNPERIELSEKESKAHINNIWYTEEMYNQGFDKAKLFKWKKKLSCFQKYWASSIMYDELKTMGYPVRAKYKVGKKIFYLFYNIKDLIKSTPIFYPIIYLKRKIS